MLTPYPIASAHDQNYLHPNDQDRCNAVRPHA